MALNDPITLGLIALAYFIGNIVKGVSGFGAILVAVPLMSVVVEPATAIALTGVSVVTSNVWQLWDSRNAGFALREFWTLLAALLPATVLGAQFLAVVDPRLSGAVIGSMVVLFCLSLIFPVHPRVSPEQRRYLDPLIGGAAGLVGGASILSGTVLIVYLMAVDLKKEQFVGAIALMYLVSAIPIYVTLSFFDRYDTVTLLISAGLIMPAILGLMLGRRVRDRVSQTGFRRIVTLLLFVIGCLLVHRAFLSS